MKGGTSEMKQPVSISIIAPIYRVEKYIGRFAESVFGQSYPHLQFIFVNDEKSSWQNPIHNVMSAL